MAGLSALLSTGECFVLGLGGFSRVRPAGFGWLRCRGVVAACVLSLPAAMVPVLASGGPADASAAAQGVVDPSAESMEGEPPPETVALAKAHETGKQVEVEEAATETQTLVANPEGTLTLSVAQEPVRVRDDSGNLVDIDPTLKPAGGDLVTTATPTEVTVSGDGEEASPLAVASDPEGEVTVSLGYEGELADPVVDGPVATYAQDADTAVQVTAADDGFAAHVLLDTAPDASDGGPVYRFPISVSGARARLAGGGLEFLDAEGHLVGSSSMLRMWDSRVDRFGDPSHVVPVDAELVGPAGSQVLELRPDPEFLADPATEYPVTIDPDVDMDPGVDTYITNEYPGAAFNTDWSLRVGSADGNYRNQTFLNFPVDTEAGKTITDAKLRLLQYGAGNCHPREMQVRMATSNWDESAGGALRSWNARGDRSTTNSRFTTADSFNASGVGGGTPYCAGDEWQTVDVTAQASAWAGMAADRFGLYLTTPASEVLNPNYEKRFCSSDTRAGNTGHCHVTGQGPELTITYTPQIGDQSWYSTTDHQVGERDTLKVNHRSGNAYLAANDVQVSSVGMDLSLGRRYNSRATTTGQFGPKWTLSGGPDVWLEKLDEWRYVYHTPDGAELGPFVRKANNSSATDYTKFFTPAGGLGASLKDNDNDEFTLTFHGSQQQYVFTQIGSGGDLYQTSRQDRSGNETVYHYTAGTTRLSSVTDTAGRSYQIGYNGQGFIDQITDANGSSTRTWAYDYTDGRLSSYTDPEGDTTSYAWGTGNATVSTPDPEEGEVIEQITDPVNDSGQAPTTLLVTDEKVTTKTTYRGDTSGEDAAYTFSYQSAELDKCKDIGGDRSALVASAEAGTAPTTICFVPRQNGDPNDDANNQKTVVFDGNDDRRSTSYSPDNQPEVLEDDAGLTTVNTYGDPGNELGDRLEKTTEPVDDDSTGEGASTRFLYDDNSSAPGGKWLPVSMIDGNGDCTGYGYDSQGRLTDTWIGRGGTSRCDAGHGSGGYRYQVTYNGDGTPAWMQDPNGTATSAGRTVYTYAATGELKSLQRPGGSCAAPRSLCTSYTYDGLSRTTSQTDGRGVKTSYSYDAMDRTTQSLADGASSCVPASGDCISYDYDTAGNLIERDDQQGTTSVGYDRMNRQTQQATPDGVVVDYAYNHDSRLAQLDQTLPGTATDTVSYTYDSAGLVESVTDAAGLIHITHDGNQRLDVTTFPTSPQDTIIDRDYTNSGRPKKLRTWSGTPTNDQLTDYLYDYTDGNNHDTHQLQHLTVYNSPASVTYQADFSYNNRGQLTGEDRSNGGGGGYSYTYDPSGNLATANHGGTTTHYGYDRANQLCWTGASDGTSPVAACPTTAPGSSRVVDRDAAGNSEGDPDHPVGYNARGQAGDIDGQTQGYHDQGNDLRVQTGTTHLVHASPGVTARTTQAGTASEETTFYTRMPDGRLLSMRGPEGTFYYVTDHHKSVLNLIDATGQRAGTYRYTPYGEPTLIEGTTAEADNPFRWIAGYQDPTTQPGGYYKLGARYYNPTTAAFTQPDPVPGTIHQPLRTNPYTYSACDPINNTDPNGRYWGEGTVDDFLGWGGWSCVGFLAGAAATWAFDAFGLYAFLLVAAGPVEWGALVLSFVFTGVIYNSLNPDAC